MVRRYRMGGMKNRKYGREPENSCPVNAIKRTNRDEECGTQAEKRLKEAGEPTADCSEGGDGHDGELPGILLPQRVENNDKGGGVIFILEKASLEVVKMGKSYKILSSDHSNEYFKKHGLIQDEYRPDIVHQALLTILDSPLNKSGKVKAVYVRTCKGVLIEVRPYTRIPRTYHRFAYLMVQLLQKLTISSDQRGNLGRVIKNPVTQYLPLNSRKIGFSHSSEKLVKMSDYVAATGKDDNLVFVVGTMASGQIDQDYTDDYVSISDYPSSAAWCIAKICEAVQNKLAIH